MNNQLYTLFTPECPFCGRVDRIQVNEELFTKTTQFLQGNLTCSIQEYLSEFSPEQREQFITGICPSCWEKQFIN